ncbi:DUF374 domain-containing protein [Helicobacter jaachi]|uniref:DUF374 domain-containing protein n=1 Tax=Helicobacter jaachi TaxID=1677920 RepID=A0A4U8TDN0_9HELI|nr:lysophospholipid acyltransferase family protein [Helicobacter jaachi]TLD96767.1 DUF374 domain-containing protein [Helicobacter jaachi]
MLSKDTKRQIIAKVAPLLMYVVLWILYALTRHRFYITPYVGKENIIGAFWHGEFLMLPFIYKQLQKQMSKERNKGYYIIASHHFDAQLMVNLCALFGLKPLRGSTSKGGLKVLIESLKLLENGYDIGIAPDGPKGPYHSIGDGVVAMSKKTKRRIIPMRVVYSKYWELKSWDKFRIPKPFSRIDYYALDGFVVEEDMDLESAKALLKAYLEKEL